MSESELKLFHIDDDGDYGYFIVAKDIDELTNDIIPSYEFSAERLDVAEWDNDFPFRVYFPDGIDEGSELPAEPMQDPEKRNMLFVEAPASEWLRVSKSGDMLACWGF